MTTDAEIACPDPNCASRLRITRLGLRRFSHAETTAVPLDDDETTPMQRIRAGARLRDFARDPRRLAAGQRPRRRSRSDDPIADMIAFADAGITTFDCADIYTGVEDMIGEFRQRYRMLRGEAALHADPGAHQVRARPRHAAAHHQSLCRGRHRPLACSGCGWSGSISCSSTGGTMPCRAISRRAGHLVELQRAGKIDQIGATNFDTAHMLAMVESGVPLALHAGAVFAARRPRRRRHGRGRSRDTASRCSATARSPAGSSATAGSARPSRRPASRTAR